MLDMIASTARIEFLLLLVLHSHKLLLLSNIGTFRCDTHRNGVDETCRADECLIVSSYLAHYTRPLQPPSPRAKNVKNIEQQGFANGVDYYSPSILLKYR
jgi:hypothetical protein